MRRSLGVLALTMMLVVLAAARVWAAKWQIDADTLLLSSPSGDAQITIKAFSYGSKSAYIYYNAGNVASWIVGMGPTTTQKGAFIFANKGNIYAAIDTLGNVNIDVAGAASSTAFGADFAVINGAGTYSRFNAGDAGLTSSSSLGVKKNIRGVSCDVLGLLRNVRAVSYQWNDSSVAKAKADSFVAIGKRFLAMKDTAMAYAMVDSAKSYLSFVPRGDAAFFTTPHIGLLAQEWHKVAQALGSRVKPTEIAWNEVTVGLLIAIKQLDAENQGLRTWCLRLQADVDKIKTRLDAAGIK